MNEAVTVLEPKPEPLFTLDLGENGGLLAPTSLQELQSWIQVEQQFWSWATERQHGNHEQGFRAAIHQLNQAYNNAANAHQHASSNPQQTQNYLSSAQSHVQECFQRRKLPHSSTPLAKRIEALRVEAGPKAASYMLAVYITPEPGHHFQPNDVESWRGMVEAILDRYGMVSGIPKSKRQAAEQSFEQLRKEAQALVDDKRVVYEGLHREYTALRECVGSTAESQASDFAKAQGERDAAFADLLKEHKDGMEALRKTFREEIALHAPADYWDTKRRLHKGRSKWYAAASFAGMAAAGGLLWWQVQELLAATPKSSMPDAWRLAVLALVGLFAVWAVRLVVRMFLSHLHLATDAEERVVMVKTYLSLSEGDRIKQDADRQLILQALFRPASDGIVKDEGLPPHFFEMLTRSQRP